MTDLAISSHSIHSVPLGQRRSTTHEMYEDPGCNKMQHLIDLARSGVMSTHSLHSTAPSLITAAVTVETTGVHAWYGGLETSSTRRCAPAAAVSAKDGESAWAGTARHAVPFAPATALGSGAWTTPGRSRRRHWRQRGAWGRARRPNHRAARRHKRGGRRGEGGEGEKPWPHTPNTRPLLS